MKSMLPAGYAVFDNANVNVILASFGGGYGVVKNNLTGKSTYMNMGEAFKCQRTCNDVVS